MLFRIQKDNLLNNIYVYVLHTYIVLTYNIFFSFQTYPAGLRVFSCLCVEGALLAGFGRPNVVLGLNLGWSHAWLVLYSLY